MKKTLALLVVLALAMAVSGCSTLGSLFASEKNKTTTTYPDGRVVVEEKSDEAVFYDAQKDMAAKSKKPIFELEAHEGQTIQLMGVKKLTVWGPDAARGFRLAAYQPSWLQAVKALGPLGVTLGSLYIQGMWQTELAKVITAGAKGVEYNNSFNPTEGSGVTLTKGDASPGTATTTKQPPATVVVAPVVGGE